MTTLKSIRTHLRAKLEQARLRRALKPQDYERLRLGSELKSFFATPAYAQDWADSDAMVRHRLAVQVWRQS